MHWVHSKEVLGNLWVPTKDKNIRSTANDGQRYCSEHPWITVDPRGWLRIDQRTSAHPKRTGGSAIRGIIIDGVTSNDMPNEAM